MTAILKRIDDPRSPMDKARRPELAKFAKANGIHEITVAGRQMPVGDAPAVFTRRTLIAKGFHRIPMADKPLGSPADAAPLMAGEPSATIDATDDLERQFAGTPKRIVDMSINELRAEMKRRGIKASRRDNIIVMRAKIEGHGKQNSP